MREINSKTNCLISLVACVTPVYLQQRTAQGQIFLGLLKRWTRRGSMWVIKTKTVQKNVESNVLEAIGQMQLYCSVLNIRENLEKKLCFCHLPGLSCCWWAGWEASWQESQCVPLPNAPPGSGRETREPETKRKILMLSRSGVCDNGSIGQIRARDKLVSQV